MNKRGQEETGKVLWELIGLILVVVVVAGFLIFIVRFVLSGNDQEEQSTIDGFVSLTKLVEKYVEDPGSFNPGDKDTPILPYHIDDDFIVVGFNKGLEPGAQPTDGCDALPFGKEFEYIPRPVEQGCPGTSACLCLYPQTYGGDDFDKDDKPMMNCKEFPGVDYILSFWYSDSEGLDESPFTHADLPADERVRDTFLGACYPWTPEAYYKKFSGNPKVSYNKGITCAKNPTNPNNPYASFVLYGECGLTGELHKQGSLYIEKAVIEGKTYIIISAPISDELIKRRRQVVQEQALKETFGIAKDAFDKKSYQESISLFESFISVASNSAIPVIKGLVTDAKFLVSEAHYLLGNDAEAAKRVAAFFGEYALYEINLGQYRTEQLGNHPYFTRLSPKSTYVSLPYPTLVKGGLIGSPLSETELKSLRDRFGRLSKALPDDAMLQYFKGFTELLSPSDNYASAIDALTRAEQSTSLVGKIDPIVVRYNLAEAYRKRAEAEANPNIDDLKRMVRLYKLVAEDYGSSFNSELKNKADTQLAYACTRWSNIPDDERLAEKNTYLQYCYGVPRTLVSTGPIITQASCIAFPGTLRCGEMASLDIARAYNPAVVGTPNQLQVYSCAAGTWMPTERCPTACKNTHSVGALLAVCS